MKLLVVTFFSLFLLSFQANKNQGNHKLIKLNNPCEKIIKYSIDKLIINESGKEFKANIEFIVNPLSQKISMVTTLPKKGKIFLDTEISNSQCNLNSDLTKGKALYNGYVKKADGSKSRSVISIEVKEASIYIEEYDPIEHRNPKYSMHVSKWEEVKN